jgi:hypothetical protein
LATPIRNRGQSRKQQQMVDVMKPVAIAMPVMVVVMFVVVGAAAVSPMTAAIFGLPFLERKFVAHADIKFTHTSPCIVHGLAGRKETIIIESSKVNIYHQNIIIPI